MKTFVVVFRGGGPSSAIRFSAEALRLSSAENSYVLYDEQNRVAAAFPVETVKVIFNADSSEE